MKTRIGGKVIYQIRDGKRLSIRGDDRSVFIKIEGEVKFGFRPMCQGSKVLGEEGANFFLGIRRKLHISGQNAFGWCHTPNRFGTVNMEDNVNIK